MNGEMKMRLKSADIKGGNSGKNGDFIRQSDRLIDHSSLLLNCAQSSLQEMQLTVLIAATVSVLVVFVSAHGHGGDHSSGGSSDHSGGGHSHSYSGGGHHDHSYYSPSYFDTGSSSSSSSSSDSSSSSSGGGLLSWLFPGLFGNSYSSYGNYYSPYNYGTYSYSYPYSTYSYSTPYYGNSYSSNSYYPSSSYSSYRYPYYQNYQYPYSYNTYSSYYGKRR